MQSEALKSRLEDVVALTSELYAACGEVEKFGALEWECAKERSHAIRDTLLPSMERARTACDKLEGLVPTDLWPLPSYTELLFAGLS